MFGFPDFLGLSHYFLVILYIMMDAVLDLNPLVLYPLGFTAVVMYVERFVAMDRQQQQQQQQGFEWGSSCSFDVTLIFRLL